MKKVLSKLWGNGEEMLWLQSEKTNIFITAIVPAIFSFLGLIVSYLNSQQGEVFWEAATSTLKDARFINAMQLIVIICTLFVIYRIKRNILVTNAKKVRLTTFIKEHCNLRDQSEDNVKSTLWVVERTAYQFYVLWLILWSIFLVYYSGSLCFSFLMKMRIDINIHVYEISKSVLDNTLNYLSSTAMLGLFVILNSVTVSPPKRKTGSYGIISVVFMSFIFGCAILFPTILSISLKNISYFKVQFIISIILGIYSALSFVLFLGKLNTNLQIPRFMFYWLYIYALIQMFQYFITSGYGLTDVICKCNEVGFKLEPANDCAPTIIHHCFCNCGILNDFTIYLKKVEIIFQYITFVGKIFLSLTLLWIVYDSKFLYFILKQSQAITELPYVMSVFKTYIKDTD